MTPSSSRVDSRWICTDTAKHVHVHPCADDTHETEGVRCWCGPTIDRSGVKPVVIHHHATG